MFDSARQSLPPFDSGGPRWRLIFVIAYAALLPMALMAAALWLPGLGARPGLATALGSYAALFASFVAGFHWGIGLRYMATTSQVPTFHFVWGPVPAYLAWGTLLLPPAIGLLAMVGVFALAYGVDHRTWPGAGLKPWLSLRRQIAIGQVLCCVAGAAALAWR